MAAQAAATARLSGSAATGEVRSVVLCGTGGGSRDRRPIRCVFSWSGTSAFPLSFSFFPHPVGCRYHYGGVTTSNNAYDL